MKISNHSYRPNLPDPVNAKNTAVNAYQDNTPKKNSAAVDLSPTARHLQQSLQSSSNDVNMERVQHLRDALAKGTLTFDSSRIADSLISSAQDLLK